MLDESIFFNELGTIYLTYFCAVQHALFRHKDANQPKLL